MSSGGGPEPERCARRSHRPMRRIACGREASTVISVDSTTNQVLLQVLFMRCTDNRCQIMFQEEIIVVGRSDQAKIELTPISPPLQKHTNVIIDRQLCEENEKGRDWFAMAC